MDLMAKIEQALIAVSDEQRRCDNDRLSNRGRGLYGGTSQKFKFPDDYARALVRALNHEGLAIVDGRKLGIEAK